MVRREASSRQWCSIRTAFWKRLSFQWPEIFKYFLGVRWLNDVNNSKWCWRCLICIMVLCIWTTHSSCGFLTERKLQEEKVIDFMYLCTYRMKFSCQCFSDDQQLPCHFKVFINTMAPLWAPLFYRWFMELWEMINPWAFTKPVCVQDLKMCLIMAN